VRSGLDTNAPSATARSRVDRQQLQRAPELPVLTAVTHAVDLAIAVLRIQHPFLGGSLALDDLREPVPLMLAEIVRLHAVALRAAIEKYRDLLAPFPDLPGDDDSDF
jgi:hypothetical protein